MIDSINWANYQVNNGTLIAKIAYLV